MTKKDPSVTREGKTRENFRDKGQFWTPDWVAEAMVSYVIKNSTMVFDPGTGTGAFFKALLKIGNGKNIRFYGTDIDRDVIKDDIYSQPNCQIEIRDFIKNPPKLKFEAIVANPPYIRHHRIDKDTKMVLKQLAEEKTGLNIDGRAGYHIYFLIQALSLLRDNGKLAFIMPADTCEGKFSKELWSWITKNYCLECVVTFDKKATPFPSIDTNAIIFFIKKISLKTKKEIYWVKVNEANNTDLYRFVDSGFKDVSSPNLMIIDRDLKEALETGLSRPEQTNTGYVYHLSDFANVMRGIATGANEFFFLTKEQCRQIGIPNHFQQLAIGRARDVSRSIISDDDIIDLEKKGRPTILLSINGGEDQLTEGVRNYLKKGIDMGLPNRPLIKQRKKWYYMEKRRIPPLLFAYLGRRNLRFIRNEAGVVPLTGFLCVYPNKNDDKSVTALWNILNHPDTLNNLQLVGKSYGSGAIKVEPRNLERLPIPSLLVESYGLQKQTRK